MGFPLAHEDRQGLLYLRSFVGNVLKCLLGGGPLPRDKVAVTVWRQYWGNAAYSDRVSEHYLDLRTRRRKAFLLRAYRIASDVVRKEQITPAVVPELRARLDRLRPRMRPYMACVALAIDAALAHLRLQAQPQHKSLALCYSAFGDVAKITRTYARELRHLFAGVFDELHLFGCAGLELPLTNIPTVSSVKIHLRNATLSQLVAFPGIKAPGLIGACADAVGEGVDFIVTIDGDARLPLFEIIPAVATILESETTDAVLSSRRIAGAAVLKPGLRHLTSIINASYVETIMGPVLGHIHDPQAIFKIFRGSRLSCALERLGYTDGVLALNNLQDGSLACELLLLANLTDDGRLPCLIEVPAIETMAYPANTRRMPIMTSENIKAMIATVNQQRMNLRERPLIGEGTESLVIRQPQGGVLKVPRCPERLAEQKALPTSLVTDNRLLDFALSFPGALRTLVYGLAGRLHPDRGFAINSAVIDLIDDKRPTVQACIPTNLRWEYRDHAIRLPFTSALVLKTLWQVDRLFVNSGTILERIGMLPMILVRLIAVGVRLFRFIIKWLRLTVHPAMRVARRLLSWFLRVWDRLRSFIFIATRWTVTLLEVLGMLRVFAVVDRLDQRSRFCHGCVRGMIRVLVEIRWILDSFNVSVHFGLPVACILQPQQIRPFSHVMASLPTSMTTEIEMLLNTAVDLYKKLGECGYVDGELSLDNLGFELQGSKERLVLMDYGSVVNARNLSPEILGPWLQNIRCHYEKSYQAYKLHAFARGNPKMKDIVETHIQKSMELIDEWINKTERKVQHQLTKCC